MKKIVNRFLLGAGSILLIGCLTLLILFRNELSTLGSLKKADNYPLYTMTYHGDYGFSDFLKIGAKSDRDIEKFVIKRLLKGVDIDLGISAASCSAFAAQNKQGEQIFARNFDFDFAPALLLHTTPSDGYASVSIANLAFAGYDKNYLPTPYTMNSFLTLAAPFLPFDGMNEKGVVMALLAVPHAEPPVGDDKVTLNTTTAIRLVLDHAANVDEAIKLLENYNLYFSGGVECHYLISDAAGNSAVVEFLQNEIKITKTDKNYQVLTNFIVYQGLNEGEGGSEFERYNIIDSKLASLGGVTPETDAMTLLSDAKIPGRTQWSVVYNQVTGTISVCMGENYENVHTYELKTIK